MENMEKKYFFDNPKNLKKFLWGFYISLLVLVIIDLFIHKHPYFAWEEYPSFYGTFGLVACIVLVLGAKYILRPIVKRRENYYD
jgi:hypothetical protein